ncbi:hypothetical protein K6Y76_20210 [Burkholderia cenocepacia]|jgi:hypothetical protein|uniref:hypothetical protein n=1 Tax=Burkholderia cepacia complex TaxID=87882 RepID=UPI000A414305|nr:MULTISPECIES: hypothetical protein [Burkholderia cepacia complex]MCG0576342.1 hypothetical protein [Burkholderia cenocepacia]MCW3525899.1 hypothetical protein [Burkholderia cenocepacia]MCW3615363.1 hypothetical protein [Burkholderia cenocepacia]MCW3653514.1 hypothetical protein [Burkholderia cenocepacia]MCW3668491.1 hypothetical protein [Burkholderia cenocepacia]
MTRGNAAAQRRVAQPAANDIRRPGFDTDSGRRCVLGRRLFAMLPKWHSPFQSIDVESAAIFRQALA